MTATATSGRWSKSRWRQNSSGYDLAVRDFAKTNVSSATRKDHEYHLGIRRTWLPQQNRLCDAGPGMQRNEFVRVSWRSDEAEGDRDHG